jgi:hypothetical protein
VIISFQSGAPGYARSDLRLYVPSRLSSRICAEVGPMRNAPLHCSISISRQSSSASTRGVKTLVPPMTNVASVAQKVAM